MCESSYWCVGGVGGEFAYCVAYGVGVRTCGDLVGCCCVGGAWCVWFGFCVVDCVVASLVGVGVSVVVIGCADGYS